VVEGRFWRLMITWDRKHLRWRMTWRGLLGLIISRACLLWAMTRWWLPLVVNLIRRGAGNEPGDMASSASLSANKLAVMPTSLDEGRGEGEMR